MDGAFYSQPFVPVFRFLKSRHGVHIKSSDFSFLLLLIGFCPLHICIPSLISAYSQTLYLKCCLDYPIWMWCYLWTRQPQYLGEVMQFVMFCIVRALQNQNMGVGRCTALCCGQRWTDGVWVHYAHAMMFCSSLVMIGFGALISVLVRGLVSCLRQQLDYLTSIYLLMWL